MTENQLYKLFRVGGYSIHQNRWTRVMDIVEQIKNGQAIVIRKQWEDHFKSAYPEMYPLRLEELSTWSTYDRDCIYLNFYLHKGKLRCDCKIYDGNMTDGGRRSPRFSATLRMPRSYILKLEEDVVEDARFRLREAHRKHLDRAKRKWVDTIMLKITCE